MKVRVKNDGAIQIRLERFETYKDLKTKTKDLMKEKGILSYTGNVDISICQMGVLGEAQDIEKTFFTDKQKIIECLEGVGYQSKDQVVGFFSRRKDSIDLAEPDNHDDIVITISKAHESL